MASSINASTSGAGGVITTADNTGILNLQTASTTAITIDASQRAAFVAGTAALPAITTTGDTNTGMFFPAADTIAFAEGGVEAMRLDASGNVGIGTSAPSTKLHVAGNVTVNDGQQYCFGSNNHNGMAGSAASNVLQFYTSNSERMRIDSSGRVCINNTTSAGGQPLYVKALTGVGSAGFQVWQNASGAIDWYNASATYVASVIVNASSVAYNTTSDYRLKDDIVPITGALDKVAQLKPVNWKWKLDGSDGQGFIAHELQAVIPDAVSGEKDAIDEEGNPKYQGVDTSFLVATLTAAIQEQQTIINDLKARVTALEAK